jgi:isopentenyldiphosphate isomerase
LQVNEIQEILNMENLEVYDWRGIPTGNTESRDIVHSRGLWHRTVHVWIYNRSGEILFQKRSHSKDSHPGLWDVSAAGHIGIGESPEETALREIQEELGLHPRVDDLHFFKQEKRSMRSKGGLFIDNEITDVYLYEYTGRLSKISPDPDEVENIKYLSSEELQSILRDPVRKKKFVPYDVKYYLSIITWIKGNQS